MLYGELNIFDVLLFHCQIIGIKPPVIMKWWQRPSRTQWSRPLCPLLTSKLAETKKQKNSVGCYGWPKGQHLLNIFQNCLRNSSSYFVVLFWFGCSCSVVSPRQSSTTETQVMLQYIICEEAPRALRFEPCGHLVACMQCAPKLTMCPICRQVITRADRTYV